MRKSTYFASRASKGWPDPKELEHYFLAPRGHRWFFETRNDSGSLTAEGVDGTEHLEENKGRIDIDLQMWGHPDLGVLLIYSKWGGGLKLTYSSKGDLRRLREWVRSTHDDSVAGGALHTFRAGLEGREGVHRDGWSAAEKHRVDRESGSSAQHLS